MTSRRMRRSLSVRDVFGVRGGGGKVAGAGEGKVAGAGERKGKGGLPIVY